MYPAPEMPFDLKIKSKHRRERKHISLTDIKFRVAKGLFDKLTCTQYTDFKYLKRLLDFFPLN